MRAGALLDAERKARLKAINEELSLTAVKFGQNLLAENNNYALELASSDLDGIPAAARDLAREKDEAIGREGKSTRPTSTAATTATSMTTNS